MAKKPNLTPKQLRQLLRYEPDTGRLFWRTAPKSLFKAGRYSAERKCAAWNGKYAGKEALCYRDAPDWYAYGDIFGRKTYAHRAIMALVNGEWPMVVDHINGDMTDNRLVNLRAVSHLENAKNRPLPKRNKSGVMGVYWDSTRKLWAAEIVNCGQKVHIGRFKTLDEAAQARALHEEKMGYHANHGRPATR